MKWKPQAIYFGWQLLLVTWQNINQQFSKRYRWGIEDGTVNLQNPYFLVEYFNMFGGAEVQVKKFMKKEKQT